MTSNEYREEFYRLLDTVPMSFEDFSKVATAATRWATESYSDGIHDGLPTFTVSAIASPVSEGIMIEPITNDKAA